jgi:hypothetical protein
MADNELLTWPIGQVGCLDRHFPKVLREGLKMAWVFDWILCPQPLGGTIGVFFAQVDLCTCLTRARLP